MLKKLKVITGNPSDFGLTTYLRSIGVSDEDVLYPSGYPKIELDMLEDMINEFKLGQLREGFIVTHSPYVLNRMYDKRDSELIVSIIEVDGIGMSFTAKDMTKERKNLMNDFCYEGVTAFTEVGKNPYPCKAYGISTSM